MQEIVKFSSVHFLEILQRSNCSSDNILQEWTTLKSYAQSTYNKNKEQNYFNIWKRIDTSESNVTECEIILHIELLFIAPFSNAMLVRMFSQMLRVRNDCCNSLPCNCLETPLRISEEVPSIEEWNPEIAIDIWCNSKLRRFSAGPHNYPKKEKHQILPPTM